MSRFSVFLAVLVWQFSRSWWPTPSGSAFVTVPSTLCKRGCSSGSAISKAEFSASSVPSVRGDSSTRHAKDHFEAGSLVYVLGSSMLCAALLTSRSHRLSSLTRRAARNACDASSKLWTGRTNNSLNGSPIRCLFPAHLRQAATVAPPAEGKLLDVPCDEKFNVPDGVRSRIGQDLILQPAHPLGILWKEVQNYFSTIDPDCHFYDKEVQVVSTKQCFDDLRVEPDHPSRSPSDTYYVNKDFVLRTHTSAHQCQHMSLYPEVSSFLCAGDVFRRDEIDASHYPVFHQCEGVRLFETSKVSAKEVEEDLKKTLEGVASHLFNIQPGDKMRWNEDYFPFTEPSFELEIFYNDDWLEVLGCGVIHHEVLRNAGLDPEKVHGWAFGLGLERLAMVLFGIPDIRLFWSSDSRFIEQFGADSFKNKTAFKPFSKYPPVMKDISMWIPEGFADNDLFEMIRDEGGDQVEKVDLLDEFTHPKTGKASKSFRVTWRDMSRTLTNEEVNAKHELVLDRLVKELSVELR